MNSMTWTGVLGRVASICAAVSAVPVLCVTHSCGECDSVPCKTAAAKQGPVEKVYTVRGQISMLPRAAKPTSQLIIHHEAINDFANPGGKTGMDAMEMSLPPAPGLALDGLAIQDIVEFDLTVEYAPGMERIQGYSVTRIRKLPTDTKLRFGRANADQQD